MIKLKVLKGKQKNRKKKKQRKDNNLCKSWQRLHACKFMANSTTYY